MQREKNVKVKEVIAALCKLLSALDVESVPTAESFRRAKFDKIDAVQDLWQLLCGLLRKAFEPDCACANSTDPEWQWRFVRSALWHSGYGEWWVVGSRACGNREEIGSRDLLLAAGWLLASGNLLEGMLRERVQQLEVLSSASEVPSRGMNLDLCECKEDSTAGRDLKSLQWQLGKMRLRWRSLLAVQQEQARLSHKVSSSVCAPSCFDTGTAAVPKVTGCSALDKDLERVQSLNGILQAYLEWKSVEPLFWCWMDSVIDGYLSDGHSEGPVDTPQRAQTVSWSCSDSEKARRPVRRLDETLLRLQDQLQHRRLEPTTYLKTFQDRRTDATRLGSRHKEEVERRVASCLQGLSIVNRPSVVSRGVTPYFQQPQPSGSTGKPGRINPGRTEGSGHLQAYTCLQELKQRKVILGWELELLRRSQREKIQAWAGKLDGLVLIPPLKR
ncbi:tubulin epsilon and delta complex protein 1 [Trichomycterus rosablanca]|uniref:tubulin epsilon and delta complex protein 1 n=1 Tax=Trichomycterus rosablanca TaxID=2290929 RepID=UPI002F35ED9B